jgi:hypothetical protein
VELFRARILIKNLNVLRLNNCWASTSADTSAASSACVTPRSIALLTFELAFCLTRIVQQIPTSLWAGLQADPQRK